MYRPKVVKKSMVHPMFPGLPEGFHYLPDFLSVREERAILDRVDRLTFRTVEMRGMGEPIPEWLFPLRERGAELMGESGESIEEVLFSQYSPGADIGWHRDAPLFGPKAVGISLLGTCRLRFQRKRGEARALSECLLEPRSAYVLSGQARVMW